MASSQSNAAVRLPEMRLPHENLDVPLAREALREAAWDIPSWRMNRLIDQMLGFSRNDAGRLVLRRERVLLAQVCQEVVDEASLAHPGQDIELERWDDAPGEWDPGRIAQVVRSLLSNAIRHGLAGEQVIVSVAAFGEDSVIAVANRGGPIPKPFRKILLAPADGAAWPSDHLGLYIVREIVHAHGGRIELAGDDGVTIVRVWLPKKPLFPI
jgi:signal transduction histidine kinase